MVKWIKRIIIIILLAVFIFSGVSIAGILYQYRKGTKSYEAAAVQFVRLQDNNTISEDVKSESSEINETYELAPLVVDFDALKAVNNDVQGWLYCEGTVINYPVLHGADNDMYLHHLYDKSYNYGGSIFVEEANSENFLDANSIIYGHNMRNGSMFGGLSKWANQEFYEEHPILWLLTPEQDYRIDILGGYTTSAYSDTYTIFSDFGEELDTYLEEMLAKSVINTNAEPEAGYRYVLLSTCAYVFDNARFVIHGKLVPVDSAGGVLKAD